MFAGVAEQQQDVLEDTAMRIAWEDSSSSNGKDNNSIAGSSMPSPGSTQESRHADEKPYVVLAVKLRSCKVQA